MPNGIWSGRPSFFAREYVSRRGFTRFHRLLPTAARQQLGGAPVEPPRVVVPMPGVSESRNPLADRRRLVADAPLFMRVGGFGPEPHWLERPLLILHGLSAGLAIWSFGLIWVIHARRSWRAHRNRTLGGSLVVLAAVPAATGLGLYYLGDARWRALGATVHWVIGLAVGFIFPWHVIRGRNGAS